MPESDPLAISLAHDRWATTQVLDACARLDPDPFHRRFDLGPGSLHDTLTHLVSAARTWNDTLAGRAPRPRPDGDGLSRTPGQLRELFEEAWEELATEARRRPLDELATRTLRDGRTLTLTRGAIVLHVTTHGMHHRAQCLNMLRHAGVSPLPPSGVTEWAWLGEK